ncbi:MAG: hypothetical protein J5735_07515 [Prevotella sp.]|nr:hypothetical protein [Prevotella sp.]
MLKIYYSLRLKMASRICRDLGVVTLLVLAFLCLVVYGLCYIDAKYRLVAFVVIAFLMLQARGDRMFLESQFGKRYKWLLVSDTLIVALPFVVLAIIYSDWLFLPIIIALAIVFPFLPRYNSGITIPSFPLFLKGSYEFQMFFRLAVIPWIVLLVMSVTGLIYDNIRITEVATGMICLGLMGAFSTPPDKNWMLNYRSALHFLKMKTEQIAVASGVLLLPFLVLLLLGGVSWVSVVCVYLAETILLIEVEMLRFTMADNQLMMIFVLVPLIFVAYFSIGIPYVFILSVMLLAWIMFKGYSYISNVVIND